MKKLEKMILDYCKSIDLNVDIIRLTERNKWTANVFFMVNSEDNTLHEFIIDRFTFEITKQS